MKGFVLAVALFALLPFQSAANDPPVITVGVEPDLWGVVLAGGQSWEDAGAVDFVYVEGCGSGTLNVCWGGALVAQGPGWVSAFTPAYNLISVWIPDMFFPATACHEFGHALGLWYERYDGLSCMTQYLPQVAAPDAQDLAALGVEAQIVPVEAIVPEAVSSTHDGTGGPLFR